MSRPRFLTDEDFRNAIVQAVRRLEPALEITRVEERGLKGTKDSQLLDLASAEGLIVVSHDVTTLQPIARQRIQTGIGISGLMLTTQSANIRAVAESIVIAWVASEAEEWFDRIDFLPF